MLKPKGFLLFELLGCENKKEFKLHFGCDNHGFRGQHLQYNLKQYLQNIHENFSQYFHDVTLENGFWTTFYSVKGILKLLSNTPTIRNFSYSKDKVLLRSALNELSTSEGIKIQQNRILLYAKNPK